MHGKLTTIEYSELVDHFLPAFNERKKTRPNIFKGIPWPTCEDDMYKELPKAIDKANICPGFKVVANTYRLVNLESTSQSGAALGLYRTSCSPKCKKDKTYPAVDWFNVDLLMHCMVDETGQDPFDDTEPTGEPTADKRRDALGQILSSVERILERQHRMFAFMLFFLGNSVRIARFDRSGAFVTRKFAYKVHGSILVDFLYRYSRLSDTDRGHDPTVTRVLPNTPLYDTMQARARNVNLDDPHNYVRKLFKNSLNRQWPWWKVEVHFPGPHGKTRAQRNRTTIRKFAVGMPHFQASGVFGRGTRGYVALPLHDDDTIADDAKFVYLKDVWRVDRADMDREGATLDFLNDKGVEYVPTLLCHGDLPGQATVSQDCWRAFHPDEEGVPLKRHQHYRLVVREVGLPLEEFEDKSSELCEAIFCCLKAHAQAFKAGIIHGDISAGNLLLYKGEDDEWYGLLTDWELSRRVDVGFPDVRQSHRTGTWQFMSANALCRLDGRITIQDELESFFHVLLYYAIRCLPHNLGDHNISRFLYDHFDDYTPGIHGNRCGRAKLAVVQYGTVNLQLYGGGPATGNTTLRFLWPQSPHKPPSSPSEPVEDVKVPDHPLNDIIALLLSWFKAHYSYHCTLARVQKAQARRARRKAARGSQACAPRANKPEPEGPRMEMGKMKLQLDEEDIVTDIAGYRERDPALDEMELAVYDRLRKKLSTHNAMLTLLHRSLCERAWPASDKGPDKKPKEQGPEITVFPESTPLDPTDSPVTGSKRRSPDEVLEDKLGPCKRRRT